MTKQYTEIQVLIRAYFVFALEWIFWFLDPGNLWLWNPESGKFLHVKSGILGFGIRYLAQGFRNPANDWNPETRAWNPESNTGLDYLSWSDPFPEEFRKVTLTYMNDSFRDNFSRLICMLWLTRVALVGNPMKKTSWLSSRETSMFRAMRILSNWW